MVRKALRRQAANRKREPEPTPPSDLPTPRELAEAMTGQEGVNFVSCGECKSFMAAIVQGVYGHAPSGPYVTAVGCPNCGRAIKVVAGKLDFSE
jgi:hypothetical protein